MSKSENYSLWLVGGSLFLFVLFLTLALVLSTSNSNGELYEPNRRVEFRRPVNQVKSNYGSISRYHYRFEWQGTPEYVRGAKDVFGYIESGQSWRVTGDADYVQGATDMKNIYQRQVTK